MNDFPPATHGPTPRWIYVFLVAIALLGAVLAWWSTRGSFGVRNEPGPRAQLGSSIAPVTLTAADKTNAASRGAELNTMYCAGCHAARERVIGPSYSAIAQAYSQETAGNNLARLAAAVTHPRPGWANYPDGPTQPALSSNDRALLAHWILLGAPEQTGPAIQTASSKP